MSSHSGSSSAADGQEKVPQVPHACNGITARRTGSNPVMWEDFVEGEDTEGWRSEVQSGALVEIQVRKTEEGVDMEGGGDTCHVGIPGM